MNAVAGPATGLDMLLLFAGANAPATGGASTHAETTPFADMLADAGNIAKSPRQSAVTDGMPVEMPSAPPASTGDDLDPATLVALPPMSSGTDTVVTPLPIEYPQPTPAVGSPKQTSTICDTYGQDSIGVSVAMRATVGGLHQSEPQFEAKSPKTAKVNSSEQGRIEQRSDSQIPIAGTAESVFSLEIASANTESPATGRIDIEVMPDPELSVSIEHAPNLEPAPALQFIARQIRDNVITALKASAVVRSPREVMVAPAPQRPANRQEHLDRMAGVPAESMRFHEAAEWPSDQPIRESDEAAKLEAPALIDELTASAERVDHTPHEVVVELNIPDWGVLEIEVTHTGDDTEVSLLADPGLSQMLREHLPELTDALSASGIEFTGLDVRHHQREQLPDQNLQPVFEMQSGERETPSAAPTSTRTALSRYRLMSITA